MSPCREPNRRHHPLRSPPPKAANAAKKRLKHAKTAPSAAQAPSPASSSQDQPPQVSGNPDSEKHFDSPVRARMAMANATRRFWARDACDAGVDAALQDEQAGLADVVEEVEEELQDAVDDAEEFANEVLDAGVGEQEANQRISEGGEEAAAELAVPTEPTVQPPPAPILEAKAIAIVPTGGGQKWSSTMLKVGRTLIRSEPRPKHLIVDQK